MENINKNTELVKIINHENKRAVSARELHKKLQIKHRFNDWIRNRIREYQFIENVDYMSFTKNLVNGGRKKVYVLSVDCAKELCIVENNEQGKKIRRYFIEVEKKFRQIQWHGLPTLIYKNDVYVNYKASLRELGYSTISGAVQARKRMRPGMFTLMFGQNWIKVDYANLLAKGAELRQLQIEFKELEKNIGGQDVN